MIDLAYLPELHGAATKAEVNSGADRACLAQPGGQGGWWPHTTAAAHFVSTVDNLTPETLTGLAERYPALT